MRERNWKHRNKRFFSGTSTFFPNTSMLTSRSYGSSKSVLGAGRGSHVCSLIALSIAVLPSCRHCNSKRHLRVSHLSCRIAKLIISEVKTTWPWLSTQNLDVPIVSRHEISMTLKASHTSITTRKTIAHVAPKCSAFPAATRRFHASSKMAGTKDRVGATLRAVEPCTTDGRAPSPYKFTSNSP